MCRLLADAKEIFQLGLLKLVKKIFLLLSSFDMRLHSNLILLVHGWVSELMMNSATVIGFNNESCYSHTHT